MNVIGLYGALGWNSHCDEDWLHDSGVTLFCNGNHVCSIQEERLTGYKYDGNFPYKSIEYCLSAAGLTSHDIDLVVVPEPGNKRYFMDPIDSRFTVEYNFPKADVKFISHHQAHAYSTMYSTDVNDGSFLIIDGGGSYGVIGGQQLYIETVTFGYFNKKEKMYRQFDVGGNFGLYYQSWAHRIYCDKTKKDLSCMDHKHCESWAGKVMGLAAYGMVHDLSDDYEICTRGFPRLEYKTPPVVRHTHLKPEDRAAWLQYNFENSVVDYLSCLESKGYLTEHVCLSGGIFLNICLNTRIKKEFPNHTFTFTPFPGDCGLSYGAAVWGCDDVTVPENLAFLGKEYTEPVTEDTIKKVAELLNQGKIVAWFQGRSEFGPRALGSRSILMSPCDAKNKNILNERVKHREPWRPFAGVILRDHLDDFVEEGVDNPYMLFSQFVRHDKQRMIPAITHEDGTCRLQTVSDGPLAQLLQEMWNLCGVPVLLNTSFNDNGMPIVETPDDATKAFMSMDIDALVLGNELIY